MDEKIYLRLLYGMEEIPDGLARIIGRNPCYDLAGLPSPKLHQLPVPQPERPSQNGVLLREHVPGACQEVQQAPQTRGGPAEHHAPYHAPYILYPPRPHWDEPQRPAVHHGTFQYHHDAELLRSCGLHLRKGGDGQAGGVVVSRRFYYGFTTFQRQVRLRNAMICGVSSETQNAGNA